MKNKSLFKNIALATLLITGMISCRKEAVQDTSATNSAVNSDVTAGESILRVINLRSVLGEYSTRGSRTVYDGQANSNGDNITVIIDYFGVKKILPSADKKHLTCPYGEGKYVNRGWKYIIGYDFKRKQLTLAPNDAMAAEIVPGSFETLYAAYDAASNSFVFQTRFTALEDKGNESEVIEPLVKTEP